MTTRKNYQIDEVLIQLAKKRVKESNGIVDISKADILGNKSLGKLDYLIGQGYFVTGTNEYKHKYSPKETEKRNTKKSMPKVNVIVSNKEANALVLAYGTMPRHCNVSIADNTVHVKSSQQRKIIKHEKKIWKEAIKAGKFQAKLVTIIKMTG